MAGTLPVVDIGFPGQGAPVQSSGRIQRLPESGWRQDSTLAVGLPTGVSRQVLDRPTICPDRAGDRDNVPVTMTPDHRSRRAGSHGGASLAPYRGASARSAEPPVRG